MCRVASGDMEGRLVVWNVLSGSALCGLNDAWSAALGKRPEGKSGAICAVNWVSADPSKLAIAMDGLFILYDPRGGWFCPKPMFYQRKHALSF